MTKKEFHLMVTFSIIYLLNKNARTILIVFAFLLFTITKSQNVIVSKLYYGNCNNYNYYNDYIDSICRINKIKHLYYLVGLKNEEVKNYSLKVFKREFKDTQLINQRQIDDWQLSETPPNNCVLFVKNGEVIKVKQHEELKDLHFIEFKVSVNHNIKFGLVNKKILKDSVDVRYSRRIKLDSSIRINNKCSYINTDSFLFILETQFDKKIYKLNNLSGVVIKEVQLENILDYDSVLYYHYSLFPNFLSYDSILYYAEISGRKPNISLRNMTFSNNKISIYCTYNLLSFKSSSNGLIPINLSYNLIIQLNENLKFENFYTDKFLSYNRQYPVNCNIEVNPSPDKLNYYLLKDYNQKIKTEYLLNFNLIEQSHLLNKYNKDSLILPEFLQEEYDQNSNIRPRLLNVKYNAWHLFVSPIVYFPLSNKFHHIIDDTFLKNEEDFSELNNYYLWSVYRVNESISNVLMQHKNKYFLVQYDFKNEKVLNKKSYQSLYNLNLNYFIDNKFKLFFVNIEYDFINGNYIYFE